MEHLGECLGSLREQTFRDFETIVADNSSSDGSVAFIKENYPEILLIESPGNIGWGGGNNLGIRHSKGNYIALLNNDTKAEAEWLEALMRAAQKEKGFGMWASKTLNYHDMGEIDTAGLVIYKDGTARGRGRLQRDGGRYSKKEEVFGPSGSAAFYEKALFHEIGLFDEDFFLYMDDVDIAMRARLSGYRCLYVPDAVVCHKYSATAEKYSPLKAFFVERNRIWFVLKCFPMGMLLKSPFYTLLRYVFQAFGAASGKGAAGRIEGRRMKLRAALSVMRAYFSALSGFVKMIKKRKKIMKLRRAKESEIKGWFKNFGAGVGEIALKD